MSCSKCETDLVETYDKQTHRWTNTKNHLEYEVYIDFCTRCGYPYIIEDDEFINNNQ